MTVRHMSIFVAVCDEGSMTRAAEKLYMAQPAISVAVSELEKHYGVKLFDRLQKRLYLTEAGKVLLQYARHITAMFDEADAAVRDTSGTGILRVGSSVTIGNRLLSGYLRAFAAEWPRVEAKVTIDNSEQIEQRVLGNSLDIGLVEGMTHSEYLHQQPIRQDNLILICAPSHPWAALDSIPVKALSNERFIMRERGSGSREILESALRLYDVGVQVAWESISTRAVARAVADGFGVAVLPQLLVFEELERGEVACIAVDELSFHRQLSAIYHKNKYLTAAAKGFLRICMTMGCSHDKG